MTKHKIEDILPLSPLQHGLLFHAELEDVEYEIYTVQLAVALEGALVAEALWAAVDALLYRHANLRAAFRYTKSGDPLQIIVHDVQIPRREIDMSMLNGGMQETEVAKLAENQRSIKFDLGRAPALRFVLVKLGPHRHQFIMSCHHILLDGWSMPLFVDELISLYRARVRGLQVPEGAGLPVVAPYREYLRWLESRDHYTAERAWSRVLDGVTEPTYVVSGGNAKGRPVQAERKLPKEFTGRLKKMARSHGLTLNTVMQGAWAILISRLVQQSDVVFGAPVSVRPPELPGSERMVGLLLNTLPVRVLLDDRETIVQMLVKIQDEQSRMMDFQYASLSRIQRTIGAGDLFDTLLVFENYPTRSYCGEQGADLRVGNVTGQDATHYPVSLIAAPGDELYLRLTRRSEAVIPGGGENLIDRLVGILETIAFASDRRVGSINLLLESERRKLSAEWNEGWDAESTTAVENREPLTLQTSMRREACDRPASRSDNSAVESPAGTLPELFATQVAVNPDTTAVVFENAKLTYAELDDSVNLLAHWLIQQGIGAENVVAVMLPRSLKLTIALLAVLKSGAAYMPVDPGYPLERVRFMFADAKPAMILTTDAVSKILAPVGEIMVKLDDPTFRTMLAETSPESVRNRSLGARIFPGNAAYVIYTSGSTGRPKGVVGTHGGLVNRLTWLDTLFPWSPGEVACAKSSVSFVDSLAEILGPLTRGGCVVMADEDTIRDVGGLIDLIERHNVRRMTLVPSLLSSFLEDDRIERARGCQVWVSSGEELTTELVDRFAAALPGSVLLNFYGCSEASADSLWANAIDGDMADAAVPIGVPIANTRILVLDQWLCHTLPGESGDLYIAGAGLARGYVGSGGLTADRFVANPFSSRPGERMYRTGDIVRWNSDRQLVYVGRRDHQVKIRGVRTELGEIEAALKASPAVGQAVVMVRVHGTGKQLVGYVTPAGAGSIAAVDVSAVRAVVAARLPEYMMPSALMVLDSLPLNPNGKIDRNALPAASFDGEVLRAPRCMTEERLCLVFAKVLGLKQVGIDKSFFDLGGHSLLVAKLVRQIMVEFGVKVPYRIAWESPTVAELSQYIEEASLDLS